MPDAVKEALRSDGTAFTVVSDTNISAGVLLASNGLPRYPILISLAAEAMRDDEIAPLTNYVAAGGFLFVGSSSFTRTTNGSTRGDFALANQMGVHSAATNLTGWVINSTLTRVSENPLVSHIPAGTLTWQMPSSSEEISWPKANHVPFAPSGLPHLLWKVVPGGATVLAQGDASPWLLVKPYGKGYFIYVAAMQPLVAHGGWAPGMYSYAILRNAIQWAFQSARMPVAKLSPWPYPYDAAVIFRHDMEAIPDFITSIEGSAQFEFNNGARGDYFFCTGELREDMPNPALTVASLQRAVSNYSATIGPHNGGFTNFSSYVPPLTTNDYDYWHWGPDEDLDVTVPGYTNGQAYVLASMSNSFNDIQGWVGGTNNGNGLRLWVSPYFNATREASYKVQEQLGIAAAGEQKLGPFPHWTLSTQTPDKLYSFLTLPVSDWFVGSQIAQGMENGHTVASVHALVDFYYGLGALVNLYSHSTSAGTGPAGTLASEYVTYSLGKPRMWSANTAGIYNWWVKRAAMQVVPTYSTNGTQSIITLSISGSTDTNAAVEILAPNPAFYGLQVRTNGVLASSASFRTNGPIVKILAGTSVTNAEIRYSLPPSAQSDTYVTQQDGVLSVPAPGVLGNDAPGTSGTNLTASLTVGAARGLLSLTNNGSLAYTPTNHFAGVDNFSYRVSDSQTNSSSAAGSLMVNPPGDLFYDDLTRSTNPAPLLPWVQQLGAWNISNGQLLGNSGSNSYGHAFYSDNTWSNYAVQARIQFSSTNGFGGGIGGRLDPASGAHYAAWVYPEGSVSSPNVLKLIKFEQWGVWTFNPMAEVSLSDVGTNAHTLTLVFQGNQITVYLDGSPKINTADVFFDQFPPFLNGGITADMFAFPSEYTLGVDHVVVAADNAPLLLTQPVSQTTNAGATVNLSVASLGSSPAYQWLKGGVALPGATDTTLSLPSVTGADAGNYSVVASNAFGVASSSNAVLVVIDPPAITTQPQSRTNVVATTATFTVTSLGATPLSYRWFSNGTNSLSDGGRISGSLTATLAISNVVVADSGNYSVLVSNAFGTATSSNAALTVIDPPIISGTPASRTNNAGTTTSFTVVSSGAPPLAYQWMKNGTNNLVDGGKISGSTAATLTIGNLLGVDAGSYTVVITNVYGSTTSAPPAALTVIDPVITAQPASRTNVAGTSASFTVGANGTAPFYQWLKGGTPLAGATLSTLTFAPVSDANAGSYSVVVSNAFGSVTSSSSTLTVLDPPQITNAPAGLTNNAGTVANFTVGASGTTPLTYQWFKNATNALSDGGKINGSTNATLTISNVLGADAGAYTVVIGNVVGSVTSLPPALLVVIDPIITNQPVSRTNFPGTATSFTAGGNGTPSLSYQWLMNRTNVLADGGRISGASTPTLTLTNLCAINAGSYQLVVSNAFGSATSSVATLTVTNRITPPGRLFYDDFSRGTDPGPLSPWILENGTWTVTGGQLLGQSPANGYGNVYYQDNSWTDYSVQGRMRFSSSNGYGAGIGGRLDPITGAHYAAWVYPEGSAGGSAVLRLIKFEGWTTWSFNPMTNVSLSAVGTNWHTTTMGFQGTNITVYYDGVQRISLADGNFDSVAPYTNGGITADMYSDNTAYTLGMDDVVVSTLATPPAIEMPPASRTNASGTAASFAVLAGGTTPLSYQWFKDGTNRLNDGGNISGAGTATLNLAAVSTGDAGAYSVIVSNAFGSVTTAPPAVLTILGVPSISSPPTSRTNDAGTAATFIVTASGTPPLTYQWFKDGTNGLIDGGNISGSTNATLTIGNVLGADAGAFIVVVSNAAGTATSAPPAILTVIDPVITGQPASRTNLAGTTATFSVNAQGTSPLYQWLKGTDPIAQATNATLNLPAVTVADAAAYSVIVSNTFGTVTSSSAILTVVPPPELQSVVVAPNSVILAWSAVVGRQYRLQYKDDLVSTNWTAISPDVTATGPIITATNAPVSSPQRFYRVLLLP